MYPASQMHAASEEEPCGEEDISGHAREDMPPGERFGFRVEGVGLRVEQRVFRVQGLGLRVELRIKC